MRDRSRNPGGLKARLIQLLSMSVEKARWIRQFLPGDAMREHRDLDVIVILLVTPVNRVNATKYMTKRFLSFDNTGIFLFSWQKISATYRRVTDRHWLF